MSRPKILFNTLVLTSIISLFMVASSRRKSEDNSVISLAMKSEEPIQSTARLSSSDFEGGDPTIPEGKKWSGCATDKELNGFHMREILPGATKRRKPPYYFKDLVQFAEYAEHPRVRCSQVRYMGGHRMSTGERDGEKAVCFEPVFKISRDDCIVYSFGISTDFSFDDTMAGYGCQVYAFDPTVTLPTHNRSEKVHFYNIGIGEKDQEQVVNGTTYTYKTLRSIMDMLGHTSKSIDYLKMDIEGNELVIFQQLAEDQQTLLQIKQIGMEIHPLKYLHEPYHDLFVFLEFLGFTTFDVRRSSVKELWYRDPNFPNLLLAQTYELAWAQVDAVWW